MKEKIAIKNISKTFIQKNKTIEVLNNISFDFNEGEFVSIFGPNGCGKTTLLNIISGITQPDGGSISLNNNHDKIGIVFQDYLQSLLPWKTCLDNICFPLEAEKNNLPKEDSRKIGIQLLDELNIQLPLTNYPYQLSGGQKQLTCIVRSLIKKPKLLLLDEPFASLDYQTRLLLQDTIQEIWIKAGVTVVFISHEIDEAIYLSDRLILLSKRPAEIKKIFDIPFPRPRTLALHNNNDFLRLRSEVLENFKQEVKE
ncbi:putative abc transporter atp-binding protein [hydrocarbon metagenome]|uniref:Putative abc transporter atp-binding protein n=1 Tax=hydrocarbon metagenome TaxID=938273 RepID=A0A0W8FYQ6_9ZZZZ